MMEDGPWHKVITDNGAVRLTLRGAKIVLGFLLVAVGVAMIVLPGPAVIVIPMGLAILATEFPWAKRLLHRATDAIKRAAKRKGVE